MSTIKNSETEKHFVKGRVVNRELQPVEAGFVSLVSGNVAEQSILNAARVSHDGHTDNKPHTPQENEGLIRFMWRHEHTSPFEHISFTFLVRAPIFVARQWFRHRTGMYNEISARYTQLEDAFWYPEPRDLRTQSTTNHQCSKDESPVLQNQWADAGTSIQSAYIAYENLLKAGVAREMARAVLPVNIMTEFYFTMNLHNLLRFLELRLAADAQPEIRYYAEAIADIIKPFVPMTWKAFEDFTLNLITLTGPEVKALRSLKLKINMPTQFKTKREDNEFKEKITKLFS